VGEKGGFRQDKGKGRTSGGRAAVTTTIQGGGGKQSIGGEKRKGSPSEENLGVKSRRRHCKKATLGGMAGKEKGKGGKGRLREKKRGEHARPELLKGGKKEGEPCKFKEGTGTNEKEGKTPNFNLRSSEERGARIPGRTGRLMSEKKGNVLNQI